MAPSEPLELRGASPGTEPEDFKDEEPKENTAEGREKVEVGAACDEGRTEAGATAAGTSGFCGACGEVGVVGILPDDLGCRSPSNESRSGVLRRDLTPGF